MKIINKNNYKIETVNNISVKSPIEWAVLSDNVELYDNTDPENPIELYPEKYRKGWIKDMEHEYIHNPNLYYDICIGIEMMTEQEKQEYEDNILEQQRIQSFKGYNIKLTLDLTLTEIPIANGGVKELADRLVKDKTVNYDVKEYPIYDEDGYETSVDKVVTVLFRRINGQELAIIESLITAGVIVLDVIGKDDTIYSTHIINDLEVYKYIVPNSV